MSQYQEFAFENLLKSYRIRLGWSQQEMAKELEISLRSYQYWEEGKILPNAKKILRIIHALQLNQADADALFRAAAQVSAQLHTIPFLRNACVTGREDILQHLSTRIAVDKTAALSQAISGLGGIGKTQIAVEYAYRHRDKYRTTLWVRANSRESLISDFVTLARQLNLPQKDAKDQNVIVDALKQWLNTHTHWLLIFDNAEDVALLGDFFPSIGNGHILLTTRSQAHGTIAQHIEVSQMSREEGALLLLRRAK